MTSILIKDELTPALELNEHSTSKDYSKRSNKSKKRKHSVSNPLDPYSSLSKQKTTVSARFNNQNRQSQNSSLMQSHLNTINESKQ